MRRSHAPSGGESASNAFRLIRQKIVVLDEKITERSTIPEGVAVAVMSVLLFSCRQQLQSRVVAAAVKLDHENVVIALRAERISRAS